MENKREGNIYDKIVKENIDSIIPALMNSVLGFQVVESVVIEEKLQQTKEKEADVLRIITDPSGRKFILHLEFQVDDYSKMVYRMIDYWGLLKSKYNLNIRQFVIFIGNKQPKMKTVLSEDGNYFQFQLINITQFDYLRFLNSINPEEIILAVLGDFGNEKPLNVLNQIILRLEETKTDQTTFQKHLRQLRILTKLRKLDLKFDDMINNMAKYIDVENDFFFIKGKKEGQDNAREIEQTKFVKNLLQKLDLTLNQIADIAGVTLEFVKSVEKQIIEESSKSK
jgi:predicted transposase YdaD